MSNPRSSLILRPTAFQSTGTDFRRIFFLDIAYSYRYKIYLWIFKILSMPLAAAIPTFPFTSIGPPMAMKEIRIAFGTELTDVHFGPVARRTHERKTCQYSL
jgi:hypothetical protein